MAEKDSINARVRIDTLESLDRMQADTGTPRVELLARFVKWLDDQPDGVRLAIIRGQDAAEEIWRLRQAEKLSRGEGTMGIKDIPAAAQQIRELVDRIEIFDRARTRPGKRKE